MVNNIEYLGLNVFEGKLYNKKTYIFWNKTIDTMPVYIQKMLKPFDYGQRKNGFHHSISAFISDCSIEKLNCLIDFVIKEYDIKIDKKIFLQDFIAIADLDKNTHYDPIISFKYNNGKICGVSFYITALKDKSLVFSYLETVKKQLNLSCIPELSQLITDCVTKRYADMFQVSWDFECRYIKQNKIYLKIKNIFELVKECNSMFPYMKEFIEIEDFRFCEIAFVVSENKLNMLNLYFKPL